MTAQKQLLAAKQGSQLIYHLREVSKVYEARDSKFKLTIPSLQIALGEKIALIGESGCGKTTLLDILTFISKPTDAASFRFRPEQGANALDVEHYWKKNQRNKLGQLRKSRIGYVMQTGGLLPYLTVRENIALSPRLLDILDEDLLSDLSKDLGIEQHMSKLPHQLSTGERQRVAIGRALAHLPSIVIADEPTASLDPIAAKKIMDLFIGLVESLNITVIVASHAWKHVQQLGLRRLSITTKRNSVGSYTETEVHG